MLPAKGPEYTLCYKEAINHKGQTVQKIEAILTWTTLNFDTFLPGDISEESRN